MKKIKFNGIGFLVLGPVGAILFLIVGICVYVQIVIVSEIEKLRDDHTSFYISSVTEAIGFGNRTYEEIAELFNRGYDSFYEAVAANDTSVIEEELRWVTKPIGAAGYMFVCMDGGIVVSSVARSEIDIAKLNEVTAATVKRNMITAVGDFYNRFQTPFTSFLVKNDLGFELGVVYILKYDFSSQTAIDSYNKLLGDDSFVFFGDRCVVCTNEKRNPASIVLDREIRKTVYDMSSSWQGTSDMLGSTAHMACLPLLNHVGETVGSILIKADTSGYDKILSAIKVILPLASISLLLAYILIYYRIKSKLFDPVDKIVDLLSGMARGNLTQKIDDENNCAEMSNIIQSIGATQANVGSLIMSIHDAAEAVLNSAGQLQKASEGLSGAANRQAASLEEISSSMEQMGANIHQNTDNSVHTNKLTEEMSAMAVKLGKASGNTLGAIQNIQNNIGDINDLVSQTNILALNASVEAARAGEQGQGFGVVAKEVGRLAEQTHMTADNINATATSSISEAEDNYNQTQQLIPRIDKIASLVDEITTASVEQSSGVQQVNTAIVDLNRVTQQNAASAEEIAASTAQMRDMVDELFKSVSTFKV